MKFEQMWFPQRNKIFSALTISMIPMIFFVIKYSDAPLLLPPKWFGFLVCHPEADKTLYNIAISYVAAYFFYVIQVYIPAHVNEKQALLFLQKPLSRLVRDIKEIIYLLRQMVEFKEDGNSEVKETRWYYETEYRDRYKGNLPEKSIDKKQGLIKKNEKVTRRNRLSCESIDQLILKINEVEKRAETLMNMPAISMLDSNLVKLLIDISAEEFCKEIASTIFVIKNNANLRKALTEVNVQRVFIQLQNELKDIPNCSVIKKEDKVYVQLQDGAKVEIPVSTCDDMPIYTGIYKSIISMENKLSILEKKCDLDGQISFSKMSDKKEKEWHDNNKTYRPAVEKVYKK